MNYDNLTEEEQIELVKKDGLLLRHFTPLSDAVCMAAARQNGMSVRFMGIVPDAVYIAALKNNYKAYRFIVNPSKAVENVYSRYFERAYYSFLDKNGEELLLKHLDEKSATQTLYWSAAKGFYKAFKAALDKGGDVRHDNDACLKKSAEHGHFKIFKMCVEKYCNVRCSEDYAMRHAAKGGHYDIFEYCISAGADITACRNYALRWSLKNHHYDIHKRCEELIAQRKQLLSCLKRFNTKK